MLVAIDGDQGVLVALDLLSTISMVSDSLHSKILSIDQETSSMLHHPKLRSSLTSSSVRAEEKLSTKMVDRLLAISNWPYSITSLTTVLLDLPLQPSHQQHLQVSINNYITSPCSHLDLFQTDNADATFEEGEGHRRNSKEWSR